LFGLQAGLELRLGVVCRLSGGQFGLGVLALLGSDF